LKKEEEFFTLNQHEPHEHQGDIRGLLS